MPLMVVAAAVAAVAAVAVGAAVAAVVAVADAAVELLMRRPMLPSPKLPMLRTAPMHRHFC